MGKSVTDMGESKEVSRRELKKHAATIHCSNTLSLLQRKITNALLYHAYQDLLIKEEHEITVKQLCKLIGYHGHNHAAIKDAFRGLISTIIEWNVINDTTGNENWTASSILASVSLEGPLCYYAYSPRMKQLLHSPSMFGKIDLIIQSKFRSSYGLALYENCIRYRGLPHTKWFEIDLFRKLMGVPQGMYDVFRDFKRRVLDKAVEEVNTYSDLVVEADYVKEGRRVVKVRFCLKERAKKNRLGQQPERANLMEGSIESLLQAKLVQIYHFTLLQAEQLLRDYEETYLQEKMALVESSKPFKENKIQNLSAYLVSALRHDYQMSNADVTKKGKSKKQEVGMAYQDLEKQLEKTQRAYETYRKNYIEEAINRLSVEEKQSFMDLFYHHAEDTIQVILKLQRKKYTRSTILESPQMKAILRKFAQRELRDMTLMSLDEFVLTLDDKHKMAWQQMKTINPDHPSLTFKE